MEKIIDADLHNHTTGSDGTQSPLRMLLRASNRGKNIVSISDHDSVKGYTQLRNQIAEKLEELEELNKKENITQEEKERIALGTKRMLKILENIRILPAAELITSYKGSVIEILGYGVDPDILEQSIKDIHVGLTSGAKILLDGTERIIKENNLTFDRFVIDNRADFKKLFFHELMKHPENKSLYENIEGATEEEKAYECSRQYLENQESPFYVDMQTTDTRGVKQIRADFLRMIEANKDKIKFDENVIANSHAIVGEFYNELIKHQENLHLIGDDVDSLKKFIYGELYNPDSSFFIDMSPSRPSFQDTVDAIHKANGKAFLAHPGRYSKLFDVQKVLEQGEILEGLDGIEVFYPIHDKQMEEYLLCICRKKEMLASGGSDDHLAPKDGQEYKMGTVDIPDIPETEWIKDYIQEGKHYINEAQEFRDLVSRLKKLKEERAAKEEILNNRETERVEGKAYGED